MEGRVQKTFMFLQNDLPNMASHCDQKICGYTLYRNILIQWDEDRDTRIFEFIDQIPIEILQNILVIQEHEAVVQFVWKEYQKTNYDYPDNLGVGGDIWYASANSTIASLMISPR